MPFINISAPSVVSGMSGESEKTLRDTFEEAKRVAPCLLFIDEIDAITPKRESAQREMERRIVAQFLTCMDGESSICACTTELCSVLQQTCHGKGTTTSLLLSSVRRTGRTHWTLRSVERVGSTMRSVWVYRMRRQGHSKCISSDPRSAF